ncbi:MAG: 50S ribosomal protein L9 [Chitinispirillaceae bacterium]|nr:50S ribosomal protein L9 [Chitinispirillaceae bacterium]
MEVILLKDHGKLGKALDVVNVKDGYARNFLIPQGIAMVATEGNRKKVEETKRLAEKREEKKLNDAKELALKIEQVPCTIAVKVGEEDKIYGSVGAVEVANYLKREGYDIDKNQVEIEEPIKKLGVYTVTIKVYKDITAKLKVWVVKE